MAKGAKKSNKLSTSKVVRAKKAKTSKSISSKKEVRSDYFEFKGFLSFLVLHELSLENLTGEDLAKKIGSRKGTVLTPGTIYPALKKLRLQKLIRYKRDGRKKVYSLTDLGRGELDNLYILFSRYFYGLKKFIKRSNQ